MTLDPATPGAVEFVLSDQAAAGAVTTLGQAMVERSGLGEFGGLRVVLPVAPGRFR